MPIAMGNAIARPAISIPATSSRLAALKMIPATAARAMFDVSVARRFAMKLSPAPPELPSVKANAKAQISTPIM